MYDQLAAGQGNAKVSLFAQGNAIFPRLAGQHAEYLVKQLVQFKSSLREGSNAALMHNVTTDMNFDQMEAVAAYLASL